MVEQPPGRAETAATAGPVTPRTERAEREDTEGTGSATETAVKAETAVQGQARAMGARVETVETAAAASRAAKAATVGPLRAGPAVREAMVGTVHRERTAAAMAGSAGRAAIRRAERVETAGTAVMAGTGMAVRFHPARLGRRGSEETAGPAAQAPLREAQALPAQPETHSTTRVAAPAIDFAARDLGLADPAQSNSRSAASTG